MEIYTSPDGNFPRDPVGGRSFITENDSSRRKRLRLWLFLYHPAGSRGGRRGGRRPLYNIAGYQCAPISYTASIPLAFLFPSLLSFSSWVIWSRKTGILLLFFFFFLPRAFRQIGCDARESCILSLFLSGFFQLHLLSVQQSGK